MFYGIGQRLQETVRGEGSEQAHLEHAHLFALLHQPVHGFMGTLGPGAHQDHHPFSLRVAHVIKQPVLAAGDPGKSPHHRFQMFRKRLIKRVGGFPGLEEGIGILGGSAQYRAVRGHPAIAMGSYTFMGHQRGQLVIAEGNNLGNFMGGAKAVEKVHHWHPAFQGHGVADGSQVLGLLHRTRGQ